MFQQIIGIFGVPRSGTSWIGQIFNSSPETKYVFQPMNVPQFRYIVMPNSTEREMMDYFYKIYSEKSDVFFRWHDKGVEHLHFKKRSKYPPILVFKEAMNLYMVPGLLKQIPQMKIVFIIRHPIGVLQSWMNAPKEFYPEWEIEEEWKYAPKKNFFLPERYYGYQKWKESVALASWARNQYSARCFIVRYEDLEQRTVETIKKLFASLGMRYEEQVEEFILSSRSKTGDSPYSVFRKSGGNRERKRVLPVPIVEQINIDIRRDTIINMWYGAEI